MDNNHSNPFTESIYNWNFSTFSDSELVELYCFIKEEIDRRNDKVMREKIKDLKNAYRDLNSMGITILYDRFDETYYLDNIDHFVFKKGTHIIDGGN